MLKILIIYVLFVIEKQLSFFLKSCCENILHLLPYWSFLIPITLRELSCKSALRYTPPRPLFWFIPPSDSNMFMDRIYFRENEGASHLALPAFYSEAASLSR